MTVSISIKNLSKKFKVNHKVEKSLFGSLKNCFSKKNTVEIFYALKNLSLEIKEGEIIGVIGSNGSGKTTLLQLIAGILKPTRGRISVKGSVLPIIDLGSDINPELTGNENIFLSGAILGLDKEYIRKKYSFLVKFSGLEKFIDVKTKHYSSGMKMRLAFSILLLANPDIVLIDEVFGVGDISFQKKCLKKFQKFVKEKKTIILVSQNIDLINNFCHKALFLDKNNLIYFGDSYIATEKYLTNSEKNYNDFGKKEIEITSVSLLNSKNQETENFRQGDKMILKLGYNNKKDIKNPMFGLAIFSNNVFLIGPNTTKSNVLPKNLKKKGFVFFEIESIPFNIGRGHLTVAIHDFNGEILYHRKEKCKLFNIEKGIKHKNFSDMNYSWSFE
ncbi:MAG: ABC transporter ATP-binding protein [Nanoarchaeota archaeon]|nr:ABC transporter ATP-binding protein [Nanoarchaeota archaeon]MBU1030482.1 ABC transporter ATP-binding protein [Nanoarchaeota archaeon]